MEELKEFEQVQNLMLMIQQQPLGALFDSSDPTNNAPADDSNRFLANFILFMMKPCGELDMSQKWQVISEHFPKIPSAFFDEALCQLHYKGNAYCEDSLAHHLDDEKSVGLSQTYCEEAAMISFDSMQRANSTLEDFCRSYFMFHDMDVNSAESIFKYLPLLSFTESYIYQLDTINEKHVQFSSSEIPAFTSGPLAVLLERNKMYTDRIRDEFKYGEEYWALERKLCHAMKSKQEIYVEEVMKAIHLKSFDYRVLNLLLYQLNGKEIDEAHMEFLSVSELLVEISDDLGIYSMAGTQADAVTMDGIDWWATYGSETPELAEVAKKVLSQPISSSSAERNWSTYSYIHNVKRNRLNCNRADKLVYIHSNIRLQSRFSESYKAGPNKKWDMNPESDYIEGSNARLEEMVWENLDDEGVNNGKGKRQRVD